MEHNKIEYPIGEVFEIEGVKYKCVRFNPSKCVDCCFKNNTTLCEEQLCTSMQREDNEEVVFEEVCE